MAAGPRRPDRLRRRVRPVYEAAAVADLGAARAYPVIRVHGDGTGHVSIAGLACYRLGDRSRLIYRLHCYPGRRGETKTFTWTEYRDLLIAAHRQLPGGNLVLIWDYVDIIPDLCPAMLCGQRRLVVLVTGGERLGAAAAGHIVITVWPMAIVGH
jgi:hypothetical protein